MNRDRFQKQYGPWALVAGASKGLGAEYARQVAGLGLNVLIVARRAEALEALARELQQRAGVQVRAIACDLADPGAAEEIARQTADLEIGLLIYNAAVTTVAPFFELTLDEHLRMLQTNMRTPLELVYRLGAPMRERRRGGIILMSSLSAAQGSPLISDYAATKAYNRVLAEGLWDELERDGVEVLVSLPAAIARVESGQSSGGMDPRKVAGETLAALGRGPAVIPGWTNRAAAFALSHLMPRRAVIRLMGNVMRRMS
jgi:uncharacterized protein